MNQYIITEDQLQAISWALGKQFNGNQLFREVRSHPYQSGREKVLDIVADIINNRITELREGKPEYYIRFGEKNTFNELQATEGEFLLLRIREELQQAGEQ